MILIHIYFHSSRDSKARTRFEEQVEDCQNKFGVRIRIKDVDRDDDPGDGGQELCEQLVRGDGVSQHEDGWFNTNLRIVGDVIHQLVNNTNKLSSHFFEI